MAWKRAVGLGLIGTIIASPLTAEPARDWAAQWRRAHEAEILQRLASYVAVPSVAAQPEGLQAMARTLREDLAAQGFAASLLDAGAGEPPYVFGEYRVPGATRTVLFYAHYDGQPVNRADWQSDPFVPVLRVGGPDSAQAADLKALPRMIDPEWRLYGRAASDDKSSIVAFLSAWQAMRAAGHLPKVNVKVLWEGDEEVGSPNLAQVIDRHRAALQADLWLIGDAPLHQSRRDTLYFGARGNIGATLKVYGATRPLHSGHYGNWAPNPAALLADLLARLRSPDGAILIPAITDQAKPLSAAERAAIAALPPVEADLLAQFGLAAAESADGLTLSTMRPALNVVSLRAGGSERAIPASAEAGLDFRLVPGQTTERVQAAFEARLAELGWTVVRADPDAATRARSRRIVRVNWELGYPAYRHGLDAPDSLAVRKVAGLASNGPLAILPMMGGSVPLEVIDRKLGVPMIGLPIANHDNRQHAPNENARVGNLWTGIETYAAMLTRLDW